MTERFISPTTWTKKQEGVVPNFWNKARSPFQQPAHRGMAARLFASVLALEGCSTRPQPAAEHSYINPAPYPAASASVSSTSVPKGLEKGPHAPSARLPAIADGGMGAEDQIQNPSVRSAATTIERAEANAGPPPNPNIGSLSKASLDGVGTEGIAGYPVPDCKGEKEGGGSVFAPIWLSRVPFWAALCVHGLKKKSLKVDVGTSLIAHEDLDNGNAANHRQVYYSLSQVDIQPNERRVIWAMCGGGGDWLANGSRVVPGHRLPAHIALKLIRQREILIRIEQEYFGNKNVLASLLKAEPNQKSPAQDFLRSTISMLDTALTDTAGLLRDTLINENRILLGISQSPPLPNGEMPAPPDIPKPPKPVLRFNP